MDIAPLSAFLTSLLVTKISEEVAFKAGEEMASVWTSLKGKLKRELEQDTKTRLALNQIEESSSDNWSDQNLEIIVKALQEKIIENPEFAKEAQESQKILEEKLETERSEPAHEYLSRVEKLTARIKNLQEDIDTIKQRIDVNIGRGDYLGKDPFILSGNSNIIHLATHGSFDQSTNVVNSANVVTNYFATNEAYIDKIFTQTEQIKGKITQFFTVKESMDELDKIRQPRAIFTGYVEQELKFRLPTLFGDFSIRRLFKNQNSNDYNIGIEQSTSAEDYFKKVKDIESGVGKDVEQDKLLLQSLGGIADEMNLDISRLNNSFILALYPASSSRELVANMVSKIGYKELREEAEMHLSVISKLVDKLNHLMQKLDIDGLQIDKNDNQSSFKKQENLVLVKLIAEKIEKGNNEETKQALSLISDLMADPESENKVIVNDKSNESIYVLSDEAQAAVGMMIDIEKRRDLVEDLVRSDRQQRTRTTQLVTVISI